MDGNPSSFAARPSSAAGTKESGFEKSAITGLPEGAACGADCDGASAAPASAAAEARISRLVKPIVLLRCPPLAEFIQRDGEYDDRADDHLLPVVGDVQQVGAVRKQAHDESSDQGTDDAAFATVQASTTDHDGRNRLQFVTETGGGLAGHEPRGFDHAGEAGESAADGVNRYGVEGDRNAGVDSGHLVAADSERVAPEPGIFQNEVRDDGADHQKPDDERHAEKIAFSQKSESGRDAVNREPVRNDQGKTAVDTESTEGDDKSVDAEPGDHQPVEEPAGCPDRDANENSYGDRIAGFERHRPDKTAEAENGTDREVDAAGDDHDGHAERHGVEHGRLAGDAGQVIGGEEVRGGDRKSDEENGETEKRQQPLDEAGVYLHAADSITASLIICSWVAPCRSSPEIQPWRITRIRSATCS